MRSGSGFTNQQVRVGPRPRNPMDPPKPDLFLRSTSAVSLHERFSQVLVGQLTQSRMVTFDPALPKQRGRPASLPVVLLVKKEPSALLRLQGPDRAQRVKRRLRRRRSVWARLGWPQVTRRLGAGRPPGFWSFTNKYRWRARFSSTYRRRGNLCSGFGRRRFLRSTRVQKLASGTHLSLTLRGGGATASRGRGPGPGPSTDHVPTKRQLDAQLDEYMSRSKRRLDAQLDEYMSRSRTRLDAELDEYMSMAGETLQWD